MEYWILMHAVNFMVLLICIPGDTEMKFGGLISTSNIVKEEKVTVQSDSDLLWTISLKSQN